MKGGMPIFMERGMITDYFEHEASYFIIEPQ